jgi:hypothetical protein
MIDPSSVDLPSSMTAAGLDAEFARLRTATVYLALDKDGRLGVLGVFATREAAEAAKTERGLKADTPPYEKTRPIAWSFAAIEAWEVEG